MMWSVAAMLMGAIVIYRGRVTNAPTAAALRRALRASNRQTATLAAMLAAGIAPAASAAAALAVAAAFALLLAAMHARWRDRALREFDATVQRSIVRSLAPAALPEAVEWLPRAA